MPFLNATDTISGREGRAYASIDGMNEEMFYIKTLEASVEKQKAEIKTLGSRALQHKATGWSGTGTMTIYYVTSKFRQLMLDYMKTGVDTYFSITIVNEDPASGAGKQVIRLDNVNLNKVIMGKLDTESDALEEEMEFTFEGVELEQTGFTPITQS